MNNDSISPLSWIKMNIVTKLIKTMLASTYKTYFYVNRSMAFGNNLLF